MTESAGFGTLTSLRSRAHMFSEYEIDKTYKIYINFPTVHVERRYEIGVP
ncbi:hypothetical protein GCM10025859_56250 [Alicyclobacillus fastidiosus]|nr:hypothetical protein GCM10025859_56250 [Alicyclobacillus fastidiosus]